MRVAVDVVVFDAGDLVAPVFALYWLAVVADVGAAGEKLTAVVACLLSVVAVVPVFVAAAVERWSSSDLLTLDYQSGLPKLPVTFAD